MKFEFPETNVVECVFSYKTSDEMAQHRNYDELGRRVRSGALKKYLYRLPDFLMHPETKPKTGDMVVVFCQTGYQVCEIVSVNVQTSGGFNLADLAWVVDVVNLSGFLEAKEREANLRRMKDAIQREKKRLEAMVTYDLIAEKNPEFAAMLQNFKELGGQLGVA